MTNLESDDDFADLLAEYDANLAAGESTASGASANSASSEELGSRLDQAKECLRYLESVWPRAQADVMQVPGSVGRFNIVHELGRGGFGIVYLARDDKLARTVALKVQRPEAIVSPSLRLRFLKEARAAGRLQHPNVATVFEVGEAGVRIWLASEYCDGGSLAEWLAADHPSPSVFSVAAFMCTLAEAMQYSHQQGVQHRDLKPSNVLLKRTSSISGGQADELSNYVPKLTDFGLAKTDEEWQGETRTGALLGTPAYMAPEQANSRRDLVGPATDVYGLGVVLYELLTGQRAFRGESDLAILKKVSEGDFVAPRVLRRELPRDLEAICLKCMATQPGQRYANPGELAADLRRFMMGKTTAARPLTHTRQLINWSRRRPALAGLAGVSLLASLVLVFTTVMYVSWLREAQRATDTARISAEQNAFQFAEQRALANRLLYASRMKLAVQGIDLGRVDEVANLLTPYEKDATIASLRGFEWYYLKRRLDGNRITLRGHQGQVYCVNYTPDNKMVVSGGQDGTIRFWNPVTGRELDRLAAHPSCVNSISFSSDGRLMASGSCDGTIKIWDTKTHEVIQTLTGHPSSVECCTFAPGRSDRLATSGNDAVVRIWDLNKGQVDKFLLTRADAVRGVVWSRDGKTLYLGAVHSAAYESAALGWTPDDDHVERYPRWQANCLAVNPASGEVCFGLTDSTIRRLNCDPERALLISGHDQKIESLAMSPDGAWMASGGQDATIRLWDTKSDNCVQLLSGHRDRVQALAFDREGKSLASGSFDGTVNVWDYSNSSQHNVSFELDGSKPIDPHRMLAISADLRHVAALVRPGEITVMDLKARQAARTIAVPSAIDLEFVGPELALAFASGKGGDKVTLWNANDATSVTTEESPSKNARKTIISPNASHWISWTTDAISIHDRGTGNQIAHFARPTAGGAAEFSPRWVFSPDGRTVGLALENGRWSTIIELSDPAAPLRAAELLSALDNTGDLGVVVQGTYAMRLVDTNTRKTLHVLPHASVISQVAFSPDSKTVAGGCLDGSVYLWNVATGQEMARLTTQSGAINKLRFSSDCRALAAVAVDESLKYVPGGTRQARVYIWSGDRGETADAGTSP